MSNEVLREKAKPKVTKDIENFLIDLVAARPKEPHSFKELLSTVRSKFQGVYGSDLEPHVAWALDMLHANKLIKRVAPGTYESPEGPDHVYAERSTGHAPQGEFAQRGKDFNLKDTSDIKNKADWSHELSKADLSVKMLKNMGKQETDVETMLLSSERPFNRVAVKLALKKHFHGIDA